MTAEGRRRCRFAIIGFGRIGRRLTQRFAAKDGAPEMVGVLVPPGRREQAETELGRDRVFAELPALLAQRPDVVVECASAQTLAQHGAAVLAAGSDLLPLSLAAFADREIEAALLAAAARGPGRLEIPAGAMASIDMLGAAREDVLSAVVFRAAYPPSRWRGTPAETMLALDGLAEPRTVLSASVREAVALFPRHINVAVGVALAGLGLDATKAELVADPGLTQARFELSAEAGPGRVELVVHGREAGLGEDPVDYTTFSLMRLLRRRQAGLMI
jgi:aspartate dehydrogenase